MVSRWFRKKNSNASGETQESAVQESGGVGETVSEAASEEVHREEQQSGPVEPFSEAGIREALKDVRDPEIGRDLITLNMIRSVEIEDSSVTVGIALTTSGCPMKHRLTQDVQDRLSEIEGVENVEVDFGVMTDDDRQNLMNALHGGPSEIAPAFRDESKTRIIAVVSGKGGVGKSTVAVNLAAALGRAGHSVEILDADVHGASVPVMLGATQKPNVVEGVIFPIESEQGLKFISMGNFVEEGQAIIWRAPIVNKALTQMMRDVYWDEPDFIVVDMPPGTGDVALTVAQMIPKAEALVVTTPQADAARVAVKAGKMAVQAHLKLAGTIENMSHALCPDCGKEMQIFGGDGGRQVSERLETGLLGRIPIHPEESGEPGRGVHPEGSAPAEAFDEIAASIAQMKARKRVKIV